MRYFAATVLALFSLTAAAQPPLVFVQNGKYGLKSSKGELIIEPQYDYISTNTRYGNYNSMALVRVADSCFLIDMKTKESFPFTDKPRTPKVKLYPAVIADGDKYGYVDQKGVVVIEGRWDFADYFYDGMARVVDHYGEAFNGRAAYFPSPGKTGFIDSLGYYKIPMEYSYIDYFAGNVARFTRGKYVGDDISSCYNPYQGSKWGLIDRNGKIVLADDTYDFIDHPYLDSKSGKILFAVGQGENVGLIDDAGVVVLPLYKGDMYYLWGKYLLDVKDRTSIQFDINGLDLNMSNPTKEQIIEKLGEPLKCKVYDDERHFEYENSRFHFDEHCITYFMISDVRFRLFGGNVYVGCPVSVIKNLPGCRMVLGPEVIYDEVIYSELWLGGAETPEVSIGHKDGIVVSIGYSTPI